ncbi:MAG: MFS transporter [Candidatus Xenobia bacterium]
MSEADASPVESEGGSSRLPPEAVRLGWVSLFMDISTESAYPVMPLFLTQALGAPAAIVGIIEGVAEATVSIMKGLSGVHSDKARRRVPYIQVGYALGALGKGLLAIAFGWPMVLGARWVDRFGKGLRTSARDALLSDVAPREHAGRVFGFHRFMDTVGAFIGVLMACFLLWLMPGGYRTIFAIAFLPGIISTCITLTLKEVPPKVSLKPLEDAGDMQFSRAFWWTLICLSVFAVANSSDAFILLRARGLGLAPWQVVLGYALYNLTYGMAAYPAGILSDRVGRWRLIGMGWLIYAVCYGGFAITTAIGVWPLLLLYGVYMGLTDGVGKALIADHTPANRKATAMGLFYMMFGLIAFASSLLAGLIWDHFGPPATFWFGSAAAICALLMIPIARSQGA